MRLSRELPSSFSGAVRHSTSCPLVSFQVHLAAATESRPKAVIMSCTVCGSSTRRSTAFQTSASTFSGIVDSTFHRLRKRAFDGDGTGVRDDDDRITVLVAIPLEQQMIQARVVCQDAAVLGSVPTALERTLACTSAANVDVPRGRLRVAMARKEGGLIVARVSAIQDTWVAGDRARQ